MKRSHRERADAGNKMITDEMERRRVEHLQEKASRKSEPTALTEARQVATERIQAMHKRKRKKIAEQPGADGGATGENV